VCAANQSLLQKAVLMKLDQLLNMDLVDLDARVAALGAVAGALEIFQQSPRLSTIERVNVLNDHFNAARRQLDGYERAAADESWSRATAAALKELNVAALV
jgi:hypothetical protein